MTLSIVIPIYNERATIGALLAYVSRALPEIDKQMILVDDGSRDGTREWLKETFPTGEASCRAMLVGADGKLDLAVDGTGAPIEIKVFYHERNLGKGGALRTGFAHVTGDVLVIQDADMEYDPNDWARMYPLIAERNVADVVYGSRFYGLPHRSLFYHHYLANRLISMIFNVLYNQMLTDIEVCYKMMRREVLQSLKLSADDFGIEIELSSQIARAGKWRIYETAICYYGRSYAEGKKINWKDGAKALWYLFKYRFTAI
jgi:glycosyltransferase involved in cell wall biosynthesis